ncbi:TPA: hypothetical protein HA270_00885, partial [Candidatus Woesearchaeota archaeon]|nr:hypothetical protein [Candidatus Woesearchaeota archaeon]
MIETSLLFLALSLILFFGFFSDVVFRKTSIPDILFLILLGFVLGPNVLGAIDSAWVETYAPLFTTFTLLFLLYDGAFNIDLASFAKGLTKSLRITLLYFILSAAVIAGIMHLFGFSITLSVFTGFMLGGVSSAFVIPLLNR